MTKDIRLWLVFRQHNTLGWLPAIYETTGNINGKRYGVADRQAVFNKELLLQSDPVFQMIMAPAVSACTEQALYNKLCSDKSLLLSAWLRKLTPDDLAKTVRPLVDRYTDQLLKAACQNHMKVAVLNQNDDCLEQADLRSVFDNATSAVYYFDRHGQGMSYSLSIQVDGQPIELRKHRVVVLNHLPGWILLASGIYRLPEGTSGKRIEPFFSKEKIEVPKRVENDYLKRFVGTNISKNSVVTSGFDVVEKSPEVVCRLSIENGWNGRPGVVVFFRYDSQQILCTNPRPNFVIPFLNGEDVSFVKFSRDKQFEEQSLETVRSLGLTGSEALFQFPSVSSVPEAEWVYLIRLLNTEADALKKKKIEIDQSGLDLNFYLDSIVATQSVAVGNDWFDLLVRVELAQGLILPFTAFRHHIITNNPRFSLPNGQILILPESWFTDYRLLLLYGTDAGDAVRIQRRYAGLLHETVVNSPSSHQDSDSQDRAGIAIPKGLNATLRSYQAYGFRWMASLADQGFGAILADDMGLGKTLQAIALMLHSWVTSRGRGGEEVPATPQAQLDLFSLADAPPRRHAGVLVVAPTSVLHNWKAELARFAPSLSVYVHAGTNRMTHTNFLSSCDVILTSYGVLRRDHDLLSRQYFSGVVADEAQFFKNPGSLTHTAVCMIKAGWRIALTGTPVENSLTDLWAISQFANPGLLGDLNWFKRHMVAAANQSAEKTIPDDLLRLTAPYLLRRTKTEVAPELPPLTTQKVLCAMTDDQADLYNRQRDAFRSELLKNTDTAKPGLALVFKALTQLRLTACNPGIRNHAWEHGSGKTDQITQTIGNLAASGNSMLVFSSFVKHLDLLARWCDHQGIGYALLTGSTSNREEAIRRFNHPDIRVFFISLKAGGTGLNLTKADYVLLCDPWWTPAAEWQAISRAHRIGQTRPVVALSFITADTVEEKIVALQEKKEALFQAVSLAHNPLAGLSRAELEEMV